MRTFTGLLIALTLFSNAALAEWSSNQAAVSSAHPLATQAGHEVLAKGGNAFDAAIAVSAALAVVEPSGSGIGGGGFWLLHRQSDGYQIMLDGREKAPGKAHRNMYLDEQGEPVRGLSINGPLAAGIPGEPAALAYMAEHFGELPLSESLAPAIRFAEQGFPLDAKLRRLLSWRLEVIQSSPAASAIFLNNNELPAEGWLIKQADLAATLRAIAERGHAGFYQGEIADKLVKGTQQAGGIWTKADLAEYQIVLREPVIGHYQDYRIVSAAPPSSGGAVMVETLAMLDKLGLPADGVLRTHLIAEAMRRAYRDRAEYMGDPDFVDVPVAMLTSPQHAAQLASSINPKQATPSRNLPAAKVEPQTGQDTSHLSIIDRHGNRVAATLSINLPFGSGFVPPGTGVLLNDEMDDFSMKPGTPNAYGLIGAEANSIAPGKRPLSSMTPTFIEGPTRVAVVGTPGGSRIISMVTLAAINFMEGGTAESMASLPRMHHQYLPDKITFEPNAVTTSEVRQLEAMGHQVEMRSSSYGNMQVVLAERVGPQWVLSAAADPRAIGQGSVAEQSCP